MEDRKEIEQNSENPSHMKNYTIKNIIVVAQNMTMMMITIIDEEKGDFRRYFDLD